MIDGLANIENNFKCVSLPDNLLADIYVFWEYYSKHQQCNDHIFLVMFSHIFQPLLKVFQVKVPGDVIFLFLGKWIEATSSQRLLTF